MSGLTISAVETTQLTPSFLKYADTASLEGNVPDSKGGYHREEEYLGPVEKALLQILKIKQEELRMRRQAAVQNLSVGSSISEERQKEMLDKAKCLFTSRLVSAGVSFGGAIVGGIAGGKDENKARAILTGSQAMATASDASGSFKAAGNEIEEERLNKDRAVFNYLQDENVKQADFVNGEANQARSMIEEITAERKNAAQKIFA